MTVTDPAAAPAPMEPARPLALDLVLGERGPTRCATCTRHLPALEHPTFELEDARTGQPLCDVCANRQHRPLRLVTAMLNAVTEAYAAGDKKAADEAIRGIGSGIELLQETATPVPYRRPVRHQPNRSTRRGRRR